MNNKEEIKSVIRPGDIPVKAEKYQTFLSPRVSDLAAFILEERFDERLAQAGPPPDPLEMGVKPPQTIRLPIETISILKWEQKQRIKRIKKKMKKYFLF